MIGLGVGIDYALFLVTEHKSQLASGMGVRDSIANAVATSGSAIVFAGSTVIHCFALPGTGQHPARHGDRNCRCHRSGHCGHRSRASTTASRAVVDRGHWHPSTAHPHLRPATGGRWHRRPIRPAWRARSPDILGLPWWRRSPS